MNRGLKTSNCRGHHVELNRGRRVLMIPYCIHSLQYYLKQFKAIELGEASGKTPSANLKILAKICRNKLE